MRWKLGTYDLSYNPHTNNLRHTSHSPVQMGANGTVSNPNFTYDMTMEFSITLYEKPSYMNRTPNITFSSGYYIDLSEKRTNERMFLLRSDGKIDIRDKDGGNQTIVVITVGTSGGLPATLPISITHMDSELAILYKDSASQVTLLITDENGVGKRKYIYNNTYGDNVNDITSISWDSTGIIYALNPYGKIYLINQSTGIYSLSVVMDDYDDNYSSAKKPYSSVVCFSKQGRNYISYFKDNRYLYFRSTVTLSVECMGEIPSSNIKAVSFGLYSDEFMVLTPVGMYSAHYNTCPLDVSIIENVLNEGFVEVQDESGISKIIYAEGMTVSRGRNMSEARYNIDFTARLIYRNKTFNGGWTYITR